MLRVEHEEGPKLELVAYSQTEQGLKGTNAPQEKKLARS